VIERLRATIGGRDPSVPLAMSAFLRVAGEDGGCTFEELAVAYREEYLELQRRQWGDATLQRGTLSVDEVRRHLGSSVIPRMVGEGLLAPLPGAPEGDALGGYRTKAGVELEADDRVRLAPDLWAEIGAAREGARRQLLELALEAVHLSEAPVVRTRRGEAARVLRATHLTKVYRRRRVVDRVDLEVRQGEIVGLLGPNGAGKTTSFYMMVGLVRPDEGRIFLDQEDISTLPMYERARRGIGYLAQEPSVFRKLTVEQNVLAILETMHLSDRRRKQRLEILLDELSIKHLRGTKAYKLSGGERRRLEITRALATEPKFMLLDEPFAGVDPIAVHDIQTIVAGLRRRGIGLLVTDHNVEQTLDIVDRAYIMFEGRVQVSGTVRDLVFDDRVADLYLGPTLTSRLRERLGALT
jgi:lipopolysaccharide export system ATP-binding protein